MDSGLPLRCFLFVLGLITVLGIDLAKYGLGFIQKFLLLENSLVIGAMHKLTPLVEEKALGKKDLMVFGLELNPVLI